MAGCGGDGTETNGPGNGAGDRESVLKLVNNRDYTTLQASLHSVTNADPHHLPDWVWDQYIVFNGNTLETEDRLLESFAVEDSTMSITIEEAHTWQNGDPVTAADVLTQFKLASLKGDPRLVGGSGAPETWEGFDAIEQTGEYSIAVELTGPYNEELVKLQTFLHGANGAGGTLWTPEAVFGRFVESYADATTDEERESVRGELINFEWPWAEAYGNGPWSVDRISEGQISLTPYEDHPANENLEFDTIRYHQLENVVPALRGQDLDYAERGVPSGTKLPENFQRVALQGVGKNGNA